MLKLTFSNNAAEDLENILLFYKNISQEYAEEFYAEVLVAQGHIVVFPDIFAKSNAEIKRANLRKYPFSLFYKNNGKVITVLRVLHQSMDPHNWP